MTYISEVDRTHLISLLGSAQQRLDTLKEIVATTNDSLLAVTSESLSAT